MLNYYYFLLLSSLLLNFRTLFFRSHDDHINIYTVILIFSIRSVSQTVQCRLFSLTRSRCICFLCHSVLPPQWIYHVGFLAANTNKWTNDDVRRQYLKSSDGKFLAAVTRCFSLFCCFWYCSKLSNFVYVYHSCAMEKLKPNCVQNTRFSYVFNCRFNTYYFEFALHSIKCSKIRIFLSQLKYNHVQMYNAFYTGKWSKTTGKKWANNNNNAAVGCSK